MKIINQTTDTIVLKDGYGFLPVLVSVGLFIGGSFFIYKIISTAQSFSSNNNWIAPIIAFVGLLYFLFLYTITITFDKPSDKIKYLKKWLVRSSSSAYAISNIMRIETRKEWRTVSNGSRSGNRPALFVQSVVIFKDGQELPIDHNKKSSSIGTLLPGSGTETAIANQVAAFLGVPFQ